MIKKYKTRDGKIINKKDSQQTLLDLLYGTSFGRMLLKPLTAPFLSEIAGMFCDSITSQSLIAPFIKKSGIDITEYQPANYRSFNEFFTRKIKPERRPVDMTKNNLISPCDSKLSVYKINSNSVFCIKNTFYSIDSLLKCKKKADKFKNGWCMIFRLEVDDYHRYIYIDDGVKSSDRHIKGFYHTVNPAALESYNIYKENTREITFMKTENFGEVAQVEVGAMLVGKISNHDKNSVSIKRGSEKGMFEYGGSTIVLLFEENKVVPDDDITKNTLNGFETIVKIGEKIGVKK